MSASYNKIEFTAGQGVQGTQGYQVIRNGVQVKLTDLNGNTLALPASYSCDVIQANAPTPPWG